MKRFIFVFTSLLLAASPSMAGQQVGSVVALRGSVTIERPGARLDAKLKSGVELQDTVQTALISRAKLLFIDDSVLTLGDNSRMSIKEFIHSSSDRGKSIFNLLDGKMRAVVGKTRFQVETPTAIAAARGTVIYFEVGKIGTRYYTRIICLEGVVDVNSRVAGDDGTLELIQGQSVTIMEGERIRLPGAAAASPVTLQPTKSTNLVPAAAGVPVDQVTDTTPAGKVPGLDAARSPAELQSPLTPEIKVPTITMSEITPPPDPGPTAPPPVIPIAGQQQPPVQPAGVTIRLNF
jgi:hypothetical protein